MFIVLIIELLASVANSMNDAFSDPPVLSSYQVGENYPKVYKWYPDYGCVLLYEYITQRRLQLTVLGLDKWKLAKRNFNSSNGFRNYFAKSLGHTVFDIGEIDAVDFITFSVLFAKTMVL
jgi:hypothetical protein